MQKLHMWRKNAEGLTFLLFALRLSLNHDRVFIDSDRSRSYGTSLFYYEKLSNIPIFEWAIEIDGEYRLDKKGRNLYVPRALCVLSHQPIFSVFNVFLRELYRNAILDSEDRFADEKEAIPKVDSFEALLRKGSICDAIVEDEFDRVPCRNWIRSNNTSGKTH